MGAKAKMIPAKCGLCKKVKKFDERGKDQRKITYGEKELKNGKRYTGYICSNCFFKQ